MEKYRFWFEKPKAREGFIRPREQNSSPDGFHQTVPQAPNPEHYDPWADWFNAGLDPEPFTDPFATGTGQEAPFTFGVDPGLQQAEYQEAAPWPAVPWDQNPAFPWFQEGAENRDLTGEGPTGEGIAEEPDRTAGAAEWTGENPIFAAPESPGGEENPAPAYPSGLGEEERVWTGEAATWPAEAVDAPARRMELETGVQGETGFTGEIEGKAESGPVEELVPGEEPTGGEERAPEGEAGPPKESASRVEPELPEEQEAEESGATAASDTEAETKGGEETPSPAETGAKAAAADREATAPAPKSEQNQRIIVWRNFPA